MLNAVEAAQLVPVAGDETGDAAAYAGNLLQFSRVGSIQFESLEDYSVTYCRLTEKISGVHDLYLVFGGEVTLDKWQFAAGE